MEQRLRETQDNGKTESKWAGFLRPTGYKPLILLFFLFLIQQFSGIYITLFYAITFLQVRFIHTYINYEQYANIHKLLISSL